MTDHFYVGVAILLFLASCLITRYWNWPETKGMEASHPANRNRASAKGLADGKQARKGELTSRHWATEYELNESKKA